MSGGDESRFELDSLERNRYFEGKLMTADDMHVEQRYNVERLDTFVQFFAGSGVLSGLQVTDVESVPEGVSLTVSPGVALDAYGRLIIVKNTTTETVPAPDGDVCYLSVAYDEYRRDAVPVPGSESPHGTEYSRVTEVFELTASASAPMEPPSVPEAWLPSPAEREGKTREEVLAMITESYHETARGTVQTPWDATVYLGAFERTDAGTWVAASDAPSARYAYDAEMLFALLFEHITDTDDPHGPTASDGETGHVPDSLSELKSLQDEVVELEGTVAKLKAERSSFERYAMRKSLKESARLFDSLAERFEAADGRASRLAREIADVTRDGVDRSVHADDERYRRFVRQVLELQRELSDAVHESVSTESLDRYVDALNEQQETLDSDVSPLHVAMAQDAVAEAADSLEELYDVVPE